MFAVWCNIGHAHDNYRINGYECPLYRIMEFKVLCLRYGKGVSIKEVNRKSKEIDSIHAQKSPNVALSDPCQRSYLKEVFI